MSAVSMSRVLVVPSYSVLEAVSPQPSRDGDYSHLEISNQPDVGPSPSVRNKGECALSLMG